MSERRGTKALELWCRRITDGYPGVNVQNMTTSWRDGLAFCAMIHHFRPDLIDFNSLNKDDVYRNNELAFRTAEQHLGIPALLDAEDMASCTVPDRLSILTYLSQFYQTFGGSSPSRLVTNRTAESSEERIAPVPESPKQKVGSRLGMRRDPCAACGLPVFLAEKLLIARTPYHRTCFRCARCGNQLTPGNYYETEEDQYCCETCPDEEESVNVRRKYNDSIVSDATPEINEPPRSLSDEEKTERKVARGLLEKKTAAVPDLISHTSQMRKSFMASHLLSGKFDESIVKAAPSTNTTSIKASTDHGETRSKTDSAFPDGDDNEEQEEDELDSRNSAMDSPDAEVSYVERYDDVHSALNSLDISRNVEDQQSTAIPFHDVNKSKVEDTKESPGRVNSKASLVQKRLQMFEARDRRDHTDKNHHAKNSVFWMTKTEGVAATVIVSDSWDHAQSDPVLRESDGESLKEKELEVGSNVKNREESFTNADEQRKEESSNLERCRESLSGDMRTNNEKYLNEKQLEDNSSTVPSSARRKESFARTENKQNESDETHTFETATESNLLIAEDQDYPESLNPFRSDEEDSVTDSKQRNVTDSFMSCKNVSTNPFDNDEDAEEIEPPKPAVRNKPENQTVATPVKRLLAAPQINLNPFWSDEEEEHDSDLEGRDRTSQGSVPVPKPRTIKTTPETTITPGRADLCRGDVYASNSSIASSESAATTGGTYKKKKPAPQPPTAKEHFSDQCMSPVKSCNSTSSLYHNSSPRTTPRARKTKPAPPPPLPTSTPYNVPNSTLNFDESSIIELHDASDDHNLVEMMWQDQKTNKDEVNRNRQSLSSVSDDYSYKSYADKSVHGKWKRKKGPAPPRPIPHRRKIKVISMKDVKLELDEIELQQQGLERQGVRLEQLIRDKCESRPRAEDSPLNTDVEELVLELFALVNEKNELFRRQAELMLLRRQQRLEEEHAEVEYQIRCLMCQPEATKTDFDKQREEILIQRLVEIVERRNEIVECLEMDRRREVEEDKSINKHMGLFAARNKNELSDNDNDSSNAMKTGKKSKTKEKQKEKKSKKISKKDADKDVDETEMKHKRHSKRKWF